MTQLDQAGTADGSPGQCPQHPPEDEDVYADTRRWLDRRRVAVKLNGLKQTKPGLMFAIAHYVPFKEKPRGAPCAWDGQTEIDGDTWGIIRFLRPDSTTR